MIGRRRGTAGVGACESTLGWQLVDEDHQLAYVPETAISGAIQRGCEIDPVLPQEVSLERLEVGDDDPFEASQFPSEIPYAPPTWLSKSVVSAWSMVAKSSLAMSSPNSATKVS